MRRFQDGEVPVFLLSLKAAGTGLNLTRADHVVHYDRWWNPAVEEQATDRAYRIGQTRPVQVHRLIAEGTIEDRIADMLRAQAGAGRRGARLRRGGADRTDRRRTGRSGGAARERHDERRDDGTTAGTTRAHLRRAAARARPRLRPDLVGPGLAQGAGGHGAGRRAAEGGPHGSRARARSARCRCAPGGSPPSYGTGTAPRTAQRRAAAGAERGSSGTGFLDMAVDRAGHIAALLDREMPPHLVEDAAAAGVELLPGIGDLEPECDCGAWDHCRHTAALCYQLARLLDQDPFVLLLMRGRGRDASPGRAAGAQRGAGDATAPESSRAGREGVRRRRGVSRRGDILPPLPAAPAAARGAGGAARRWTRRPLPRPDRRRRAGVPGRASGGAGAPAARGGALAGTSNSSRPRWC